jgi:hypothetical protein
MPRKQDNNDGLMHLKPMNYSTVSRFHHRIPILGKAQVSKAKIQKHIGK